MLRSKRSHSGEYRGIQSPAELEEIIQEQQHFIEILKNEKLKLEQRMAVLESERSTVLRVMDITQQNAEEILEQANREAESIVQTAQLQAERQKNDADCYLKDILDLEASLEGLLQMIHRFKDQVNKTADSRIQSASISS